MSKYSQSAENIVKSLIHQIMTDIADTLTNS